MNTKFLKTWFITAGSFAGLAIVYYIVRIIDQLVNRYGIEGTLLDKLNLYALICLGIALLMFIAIIPISKLLEKKNAEKLALKEQESTLLAKYKTKKTK